MHWAMWRAMSVRPYRTDLVVGVHDRHQAGQRRDSRRNVRGVDQPLIVDPDSCVCEAPGRRVIEIKQSIDIKA